MPKAKILNRPSLFEKLLKHLSQSGPLKAKDLSEFLNISQPALSRLIRSRPVGGGESLIIRIGHSRHTRYALHRLGAWGKPKVPVFLIDEKGTARPIATLHPLSPQGFYLESESKIFSNRVYKNLPYFFEDLRPSGFLGRLIPRLYPELGFPEDISIWTEDHSLLYLARCGSDLIGNLMIGEESYNIYLKNRIKPPNTIADADRKKWYPKIADLVLSTGIPGSSAAGEQPKFLSIRKTKRGLLPVLVKFSPPVLDAISHRVADLLICEHIAHEVLRRHGKASPTSSLIKGEGRLFLEIERFDRNSSGGRLGMISLRALDLEFVGQLRSWRETAESLCRQKIIDPAICHDILWLEVFGRLIGNIDRHHGNISFFCDGEKINRLAPVYDMLPMMYAPQQNQLVTRTFEPDPPKFFEIPVWDDALAVACDFWLQVQRHLEISKEFKIGVADNESKLSRLSPFTRN